jgi:flagellar motor protein MotB
MAHDSHDDSGEKSGGHGGGHRAHGGGHGGGHEEGHEGAPEWLISFADNVALMMGFFVILLAMNMKPVVQAAAAAVKGETSDDSTKAQQVQNDLLDFAIGVREAFNNPVREDNPNDALLMRRIREKRAEAESKTPGQKGSERDVKSIRPADYYGMGGTIGFEAGADELSPSAREELADLLTHRRGSRNVIEVRGHCSAAEVFGRTDRGMELSTRRAMTVARALAEAGIAWEQIRVIGCADNERVAQKTYDQLGHRANQRVEVIETPRGAGDEADPPPTPTPEP